MSDFEGGFRWGAAYAALALCVLALLLAFGRAEHEGVTANAGIERELAEMPRATEMPYVAPALGLDRYIDCARQRGRQPLRLQVAHKRDREGVLIFCYYDGGVYL